jgi:hypothetical protein
MSEASTFRLYAEEAMRESSNAAGEAERRALEELAVIWAQAALMSDRVFGSSLFSSLDGVFLQVTEQAQRGPGDGAAEQSRYTTATIKQARAELAIVAGIDETTGDTAVPHPPDYPHTGIARQPVSGNRHNPAFAVH